MTKKSVEKQKTHKEDSRYEKQIATLERENKRLKNDNKNLLDALRKTDEYIFSLVKDKTVAELVQDVKDNVVKETCPNCGADQMRRVNLGEVVIVACNSCTYRNREHAGNRQA